MDISKFHHFKDKSIKRHTVKDENYSAFEDCFRVGWAQVYHSNEYATGTLASGL